MPRGKMLHTKIKEEILKSQIVAEAVEVAKQKIYQKVELKKPLMLSVREHLGKLIDRIDPLELGAILGTTVLIKNGIDWVEVNAQKRITRAITTRKAFWEELHIDIPAEAPEQIEFTSDMIEWLLSFALAFYIMRHGKEIQGSVLSMAKALLV